MAITSDGPNAEQIRYWNEVSGPKWVALDAFLDAQIAPLGAAGMDHAAIRAGERILDIGCGCGNTTVELARRVGAHGHVTGIDISRPMLNRARQRASDLALDNVQFENSDAQTHAFTGNYDLLFSRFGVMFFADSATAFANLRGALRPNGRLTFVCWQPIQLNPWMLVPVMAAMQHITIPTPSSPDAPGPFAFANPDRVRQILTTAGFSNVSFVDLKTAVNVDGGHNLDSVVDFLLQMGPVGQAAREAPADALPKVAAAIRDALQPFATDHGVRMDAAVWIVSAQN